jgi:hypothetical protein
MGSPVTLQFCRFVTGFREPSMSLYHPAGYKAALDNRFVTGPYFTDKFTYPVFACNRHLPLPPLSHPQAASFGADSLHPRSRPDADSNMGLRFNIPKTAIIGYFLYFFSGLISKHTV